MLKYLNHNWSSEGNPYFVRLYHILMVEVNHNVVGVGLPKIELSLRQIILVIASIISSRYTRVINNSMQIVKKKKT